MIIRVIVVLTLLVGFLVYTGWFAFFPKHAISTLRRLPWGLRLPVLIHASFTQASAILIFLFLLGCLILAARSIISGDVWHPPT